MTSSFYAFDHDHVIDDGELRARIGGKGAGLATMAKLGIPVPPGFTIPTATCLSFLEAGFTPELSAAIRSGVAYVEQQAERRLGDPSAPLLLSVRSGAAISMPGMMDTVLNVGMTKDVARGLIERSGDVDFGWDTYERSLVSFATVVLGASTTELAALRSPETGVTETGASATEASATAFAAQLRDAGWHVPDDPFEQVEAAVKAVFSSWHSRRATDYRNHEGIDHDLGTAATIQAMVFGNMGGRSGTGVAFSRSPSTGVPGLMGDFLVGAQGEDVVAGTHQTLPLSDLQNRWPEIWTELTTIATTLEHQSADMVDLEFTVEDGRLWLLQTRVAKRSPIAAFRAAVDMATEPDFPLDRAQAVERCASLLDDPPHVPDPNLGDQGDDVVLATGLAASPGRAVGVLSVDPDDAVQREQRGEKVILVREETSPADVHGMGASVGLVTTLGGMVSHAAVVARSWGLAAVVGCEGLELADNAIISGDRRIEAGTLITVDGDQGRLLLGERRSGMVVAPEVETIRDWARETGDHQLAESLADESPAESTVDISLDDCLRLIAIKGMTTADALVEPLGASEERSAACIAELETNGLVEQIMPGRFRPTDLGKASVQQLYADEASSEAACNEALDRFHEPNMALKEVVTAWQVKMIDGEQVMNDHADAAYDAEVLRRLRDEVHAPVEPILDDIAGRLPRLGRYRARLDNALRRLDAAEYEYVAHPLRDSYHTVWFELHEELIRLAGRDRKSEAEAGRA